MGTKLIDEGTEVTCNICGHVELTEKRNGVAPSGWMTGQLWLDISLSEQAQVNLCFCPTCEPKVRETGLRLSLVE